MREDTAEQYLLYKLIDSNQDWKAKWFYITNHHPGLPKPSGKQPKHCPWWNTEPTMQEGIQLPELLARIKALREAGLRAKHVAFSFMKRRVQPLMARDTLGFEYTGDDHTSRMPGDEVEDDDIVNKLTRIFKDMPPYMACPVPEYSASRPPKEVSVTEPPKIVPYYRLSLSTWPLSNNKELFCRSRRVKPGKSHTTGSLICAKPTRRWDQSTTLHYIKVHKFNIITNQVFRT
jgi:hypothetical protein